MSEPTEQMYIRFIGPKVCFTLPDGKFYMADPDECSQEELEVAKRGDYLPVTRAISIVAK